MIPDARLVTLEGRNHLLLEGEPAFEQFLSEVDAFLAADEDALAPKAAAAFPELTDREAEVLRLVARGLANGNIAERLRISDKTVRNHVTNIFWKLGATTRAEVIVRARDAGFGADESPSRDTGPRKPALRAHPANVPGLAPHVSSVPSAWLRASEPVDARNSPTA
jgi:DNA-binding CsgD family transcriptional regulator